MIPHLDTGRVRIRLACSDGRVDTVQVSSERPEVSQLLRGRTTQQAIRMVGLMFALCGNAQTRAASLAMAAAHGDSCVPGLDRDVQREALREHLWRCLLDLPPLLGEVALQQEFVAGAKSIASGQRGELSALLATTAVQALRKRLTRLDDGQPATHGLLPRLSAASSLNVWLRLTVEFCRQPEWHGAAAETGALARHQNSTGGSLSAHWQARFDELAEWAAGHDAAGGVGTVSAVTAAQGVGRALVETARGLLMHEVALDGDVVVDYLVVAPTEWNFHPQGVLRHRLLGADARDRDALRRQVARLVATLDPCVPWELEMA